MKLEVYTLEQAITEIEKMMMTLPNDPKSNKSYLAGVIDSWEEFGVITEEDRGELYMVYCE